MDRLIELLRQQFEEQLQAKTGWGRNEVLTCFDKACIRAMVLYAREKGFTMD